MRVSPQTKITTKNTRNIQVIQVLAHDATAQKDWAAAMRYYCAWLALDPESEFAQANLARTTSALMDSMTLDSLPVVGDEEPPATKPPLAYQLREYAYVRQAIERSLSARP